MTVYFGGGRWASNMGVPGYHDTELCVGEVYGLRAWQVDAQGILHGVSYPQAWAAEHNVALCLQFSGAVLVGSQQHREDYVPREKQRPCAGIETSCGCGFWQQNASETKPWNNTGILGVVRGYGIVVEGSKGFRSQYADIVALHIPERPTLTLRAARMWASTGSPPSPNMLPNNVERLVRAAYPDIPIYADRDQMLTDWPLSSPPESEATA